MRDLPPAPLAAMPPVRQPVGAEQVNHPAHYNQGGIECIDAIKAALGPDGFVAWLRGTILKYQWRLGLKDAAAQDAARAHWYSERLFAALRKGAAKP